MTTYGPRVSTRYLANPYNPAYRVQQSYRSGYVQKPRTDSPTQVTITKSVFTRPDLWNNYCDAPNTTVAYNCQNPRLEGVTPGNWGLRQYNESLNKCYGKFRDKVYTSSASFAANLAEWRQTVDTIANDATVLRRAWNALRRGRFREFKKVLGLTLQKGESPWSKPELAGSLWLQYHFGWEPLVKDIHEACIILESNFPSTVIRTRASSAGSYVLDDNYGGNNYRVPRFTFRCHMQAKVRCINPNLHQATALGLTNPLSVLWEVVPFSFVVDWFWPVGEFLESWSDFFGLEFTDAFTTRTAFAKGDQYVRALKQYGGGILQPQYSCEAKHMVRALAIQGPAFPFPKHFKGFSVARGATAIALLVGALSSERRYFNQTA